MADYTVRTDPRYTEDPVFARVEEIVDRAGEDAELEVIRFAA